MKNDKKIDMEYRLTVMRFHLFLKNANLIVTSFIYFLFYPVILFMTTFDDNIGDNIQDSMVDKIEDFDNKIEEFNALVCEYNKLYYNDAL